jgi:hypothetical protein
VNREDSVFSSGQKKKRKRKRKRGEKKPRMASFRESPGIVRSQPTAKKNKTKKQSDNR